MTINERLQLIINTLYKGNKSAFSKAIGTQPNVIENIVGSRQSKPSFGILEQIITNVDISAEWLITGAGEISKRKNDNTSAQEVEKLSILLKGKDDIIKTKEGIIRKQESLIKNQENLINNQNSMIEHLKADIAALNDVNPKK